MPVNCKKQQIAELQGPLQGNGHFFLLFFLKSLTTKYSSPLVVERVIVKP